MPSDDRLRLALDAVAPQIAAYRSAVSSAAKRVRDLLSVGDGATRARDELGSLGATRIDVARFAELSRGPALDASARDAISQAGQTLHSIALAPESAFVVNVLAGERTSRSIARELADFGRAFSVVRAVDLVRTARVDSAARQELAREYGPDRWTSAERNVAPPIVAVVSGADLHAAELSELLDGSIHIVLVVEGACPPAALVRLVTPSTLVLQTDGPRGFEQFKKWRGPAVAALVDADAAMFLHDPARGASVWQRLEIWKQPASLPRKRIGGVSARQQSEELAQLSALATQPALSASKLGDFVPAAADSVDRLAEWLLSESGLPTRQ